ncbi:DUF3499 family protein [Dermatobacter hominis]|uniref:DUF3499 family protein n=1 Tax=Dermatobacter hominis TaxID=2884263 RepID=UPI001D123862|nr:DUF3499 family protein [Dermatobacter hominis]UDY34676.1 DUF3499 family protein [Dermatobacter hominis]
MARTCMRPGCDRPAAARVAFDPVALQLWLDPLSRRAAPVQELCDFHVERLTIPRGWTATDRRPGSLAANADIAAIALLEPPVDLAPSAEPVQPEPISVEPEPILVEPEPIPVEPEPVVALEREPEPVAVADHEPVLVVEPELDLDVEPDPEPVLVVEPELDLDVEPDPEPVVEPEPEPEPEVAAATPRPRRPSARRSPARSSRSAAPSLLSRAFELTGHQESILTRATPDADPEDADG